MFKRNIFYYLRYFFNAESLRCIDGFSIKYDIAIPAITENEIYRIAIDLESKENKK
tara:strand:+ start:306 stop:473 length:168 start_codon:yes stop_codon:yes gene_type:complete